MDVEIEPFIAEKESHFQTCRFTKLDLHNTRAVPSPGRTAYCSPGGGGTISLQRIRMAIDPCCPDGCPRIRSNLTTTMAMTRSPFSLQRASDNKEQSLMVCDEDRGREDNRAMDGGDRKWAGTVKN